MEAPLFCPTGQCVKFLYQCTGGHYCDLQRPFLCADMTCAINLRSCIASLTGKVFPKFEIIYDSTIANINNVITKHRTEDFEFSLRYESFLPFFVSPFTDEPLKHPTKKRRLF